jgi:AraC-like DNA-binding protein/mannose-6-phosphate isomerase-like protein (cupin superfamily)
MRHRLPYTRQMALIREARLHRAGRRGRGAGELIVTENDPGRGVSVATFGNEYPRGFHLAPHAHLSDQLMYASSGVMQVSAGRRVWTIPPRFGLWIPAGTVHQITMPEQVSMRTLYLRPHVFDRWTTCTVLHVRPFLRHLIIEIVGNGGLRARRTLDRAFREILVAELGKASALPIGVTLPGDPRASAVAHAVLGRGEFKSPLASLCHSAGVGVRTLQRIFRKELGMDFETWRRQVRLMKAIERLAGGESVKEAAFHVGYREASALVALFRVTLGMPPKAWMSSHGAAGMTIR